MKLKLIAFILLAGAIVAPAQSPWTNTKFTPMVLTATSQTVLLNTTGQLGQGNQKNSFGICTLSVTGSSLTTATFAIKASVDGTNYVSLLITPVGSTTGATTQTVTSAPAGFTVPCGGWSYLEAVSSGTFTATSITITVVGSPNAQVASAGVGGGGGSATFTPTGIQYATSASAATVATPTQMFAAFATQAAHCFFAGPSSGSAANATCRAIVAGDLPDLSSIYVTPAALNGGTLPGSLTVLTLGTTGTCGVSGGVMFTDGFENIIGDGGNIVFCVAGNSIAYINGGALIVRSGNYIQLDTQAAASNNTRAATTEYVDRAVTNAIQEGVTGSIGGSLLTAGTCATGTATVTNSEPAGSPVAVAAADGSAPNALVTLSGYVLTTGTTVTVQVCAIAAVTPAAKAYNVAVF